MVESGISAASAYMRINDYCFRSMLTFLRSFSAASQTYRSSYPTFWLNSLSGTATDSETREDKVEDSNDSFDVGEGADIEDKLSLHVASEAGDPVELLTPSAGPPCPTMA